MDAEQKKKGVEMKEIMYMNEKSEFKDIYQNLLLFEMGGEYTNSVRKELDTGLGKLTNLVREDFRN